MEWRLHHTTRYEFAHEVHLGPHQIRLRPRISEREGLRDYQLNVWPQPGLAHWRQDLWQNWVYQIWFNQPVTQLLVSNRLRYRPSPVNPFRFVIESQAVQYPPDWGGERAGLAAYLELDPDPETEFLDWVESWRRPGTPTLSLALDLNRAIHARNHYVQRDEPGVQSPAETLRRGSGACRDTSWLLVQTLRALDLPARYVSGYWVQVETTALELHAWAELYLPGAGWLGLDPTAGLAVGEQHLALAHAPRPEGTTPVDGTLSPTSGARFGFRLKVRRCS
jgi:transglutaminase-like putative cysteine protease